MNETMTLESAIEEVLKTGPNFELIAGLCKMAVKAERQSIAVEFEKRHEAVKHHNNYWLHASNYVRARSQA